MQTKKIIFHIPNYISTSPKSGSEIRPTKMLEAFRKIGYEVDVVMGYVADRKKQIKKIKDNIKNGMKYEFLYSESSTMPTALTEKHHLPIAPFLDFNFFRFCNQHNIKIGLFYRDIHWNFEQYKLTVSLYKQFITKFFYKFDLKEYRKLVDILYLPSVKMYDYIPFSFDRQLKSLPPAVNIIKNEEKKIDKYKLNFIYVGGLGKLYDLRIFTKIINNMNTVNFYLCTRKIEWEKNKKMYSEYLNNVQIYHKYGNDLHRIYNLSTIGILFVKPIEYWNFVMAVKLFEYIAYKKPIIAVKGTAVGSFVEENNIGWAIEYNEKTLEHLLAEIQNNPNIIEEKIENIEKIIPLNTWEARAEQVVKDLSI